MILCLPNRTAGCASMPSHQPSIPATDGIAARAGPGERVHCELLRGDALALAPAAKKHALVGERPCNSVIRTGSRLAMGVGPFGRVARVVRGRSHHIHGLPFWAAAPVTSRGRKPPTTRRQAAHCHDSIIRDFVSYTPSRASGTAHI